MTRALALFSIVLAACTTQVAVGSRAPRLIAPLSSASVTSSRPRLRWELPPGAEGARVELCADRACTAILATIDASGTSAVPSADLPAGPVFWRVSLEGESSPTWELFVRRRSAPVSTSWGTTLDLNADGHPDLAVGAPNDAVDVYFGSASAIDATSVVTLSPLAAGDFGVAVASAGDVNGDGFADLAIGAPGASSYAYVYFGSAEGIDTRPSITLTGADRFGASLGSVGDVNHDGYADLGVGGEIGRLRIFFGGPAGTSTHADVTLEGALGNAFACGDVNGDGWSDVIVAGTASGRPCAYLHLGSDAGLSTSPTVIVGPDDANSGFGTAISSAADLNGDGCADLAIGAPFEDDATRRGSVHVFVGSATGPSSTATVIDDPSTASDGDGLFGSAVASAADVDGDGFDDLVVGAPLGRGRRGSAYFYVGGAGGIDTGAASLFDGVSVDSRFGEAVGSAGDVDGDGYAELVVGAPGEGRVFVFIGNPSGPAEPRAATLTRPDGAGAFGAAFAGHPR